MMSKSLLKNLGNLSSIQIKLQEDEFEVLQLSFLFIVPFDENMSRKK